MNARPPLSLIVGGKNSNSEDSPLVWKSCLARLVINASFLEPVFVNAETDNDKAPIRHYHIWSHVGLSMRVIGPSSSLMWTDMSGNTEVAKLGDGCLFFPSPNKAGSQPLMQMVFDDDRLDPRRPDLPDEVNDHWFNAHLPASVCDGIVKGIKGNVIRQLLVSAYCRWKPEEGQGPCWISDDFAVFQLKGADWYPIPEDFYH